MKPWHVGGFAGIRESRDMHKSTSFAWEINQGEAGTKKERIMKSPMTPRLEALMAAFDILTSYLLDECPDDANWEDFDGEVDHLRSEIDDVIQKEQAK
jgi:hypothetical protein